MNFDQMLETWKAQDEAPLYGVNADLLQLVLQHEQADLRRAMRLDHWTIYGASTLLLAISGAFLWAFLYYGGTAWDQVAAAVATGVVLAGAAALWLGRKREAQRERGFGNSLREEIGRSLSLLDYQLSRIGQTERALLAAAPITLAGVLIYWLAAVRINDSPSVWYDAGMILVLVVIWATSATARSRKTKQQLLPRRQRLSELLEILNASE